MFICYNEYDFYANFYYKFWQKIRELHVTSSIKFGLQIIFLEKLTSRFQIIKVTSFKISDSDSGGVKD